MPNRRKKDVSHPNLAGALREKRKEQRRASNLPTPYEYLESAICELGLKLRYHGPLPKAEKLLLERLIDAMTAYEMDVQEETIP